MFQWACNKFCFLIGKHLNEPNNDTLWRKHGTQMKQYVVPQTWSFDGNGVLKPFEYLAADIPMPDPPELFITELYLELKNLGLEGNLGVRRIDNVIGESTWETTPEGTRSNVVVFGPQPDDVEEMNTVPVLWFFDKKGKLRQGTHCVVCFFSCHHCGTCTH